VQPLFTNDVEKHDFSMVVNAIYDNEESTEVINEMANELIDVVQDNNTKKELSCDNFTKINSISERLASTLSGFDTKLMEELRTANNDSENVIAIIQAKSIANKWMKKNNYVNSSSITEENTEEDVKEIKTQEQVQQSFIKAINTKPRLCEGSVLSLLSNKSTTLRKLSVLNKTESNTLRKLSVLNKTESNTLRTQSILQHENNTDKIGRITSLTAVAQFKKLTVHSGGYKRRFTTKQKQDIDKFLSNYSKEHLASYMKLKNKHVDKKASKKDIIRQITKYREKRHI
jgi:hypothetical protein